MGMPQQSEKTWCEKEIEYKLGGCLGKYGSKADTKALRQMHACCVSGTSKIPVTKDKGQRDKRRVFQDLVEALAISLNEMGRNYTAWREEWLGFNQISQAAVWRPAWKGKGTRKKRQEAWEEALLNPGQRWEWHDPVIWKNFTVFLTIANTEK